MKRAWLKGIIPTVILSIGALWAGDTLYVKGDATGANNGTSWEDAFTDLQDALAVADSGDQIWVASGFYFPDSGASFVLHNGVALYGGFRGNETSLSQRDWSRFRTILSGDVDHNDRTDFTGVTPHPDSIVGRNALHVVQIDSGASSATLLDGFLITAGMADLSGVDHVGGGVLVASHSQPVLRNLILQGNTAHHGGGMFIQNESHPRLENVTFRQNSTFPNGDYKGGGLYTSTGSQPLLINVRFVRNTAVKGGGMYTYLSEPTVANGVFYENQATNGWDYGGFGGGGILNDQSTLTLRNCTFYSNTAHQAGFGGGGICNFQGTVVLTNGILWGNQATTGAQVYNYQGTVSITYSDVQGGFPGTGNVDGSPNFVDPSVENFQLRLPSPCVDAGNSNAVPPWLTSDIVGNPRIVDGDQLDETAVDMGAYEYVPHPGDRFYVKWNATGANNGTSWENAFTDLQDALAAVDCGDEIWVAQGVYYPGNDSNALFYLKAGVWVYGGFRGDETALDQRNWQLYPTILSGDVDHNDHTDSLGITPHPDSIVGNNALHILEIRKSNVEDSTVIDGFVITGGKNPETPHIEVDTLSGNTLPSTTSLIDSIYQGGGALVMAAYGAWLGPIKLRHLRLQGNTAWAGAGITAICATIVAQKITIQHNSATRLGGGLYGYDVAFHFRNCRIADNQCYGNGGGLCFYTISSHLTSTMEACTLQSNTSLARAGGAIYFRVLSTHGFQGKALLFQGNTAWSFGGGLHAEVIRDTSQFFPPYLQMSLSQCQFTENVAGQGGGIYLRGVEPTGAFSSLLDATIDSTRFQSNQARSGGEDPMGAGIITIGATQLSINYCAFQDNQAISYCSETRQIGCISEGGAIANWYGPTVHIVGTLFQANQAGKGGALLNTGVGTTVHVENCLFVQNFTNTEHTGEMNLMGGAVLNVDSCSPTFVNCTFTQNYGMQGGAIANYVGASPRFRNCILWDDSSDEGGEVFNPIYFGGGLPIFSRPRFSHCNVQGCGGSGGGWNPDIGVDEGGNMDQNPAFWAPDQQDFRLRVYSPCVDAGDSTAVSSPVDLAGNPRIVDGNLDGDTLVDMGAYEFQPTLLTGDLNSDGIVDALDMEYLAQYLYDHGPAPVPMSRGDINHDQRVNDQDLVNLSSQIFPNKGARGPLSWPLSQP